MINTSLKIIRSEMIIFELENMYMKELCGYAAAPRCLVYKRLSMRKPDQVVSLAADRSETNTAVSGLPGRPFTAAQPPLDQSPITIRCIDQSGLSLYPCLLSARAVCCEAEHRWLQGCQKNITDKKRY